MWLSILGKVLLKHVRQLKYDPIVEEAELIEANPCYALHIFVYKNGKETMASLQDLTLVDQVQNYYPELPTQNFEILDPEQKTQTSN